MPTIPNRKEVTPSGEPTTKKEPFLEEEIVELEKELAEKKKELEEKEILREVVGEKFKEVPFPARPSAPPSAPVVKKAKELKGEKKEKQVKLLTDLVFEKGVSYAVEVAKKLDNPYILDAFHDTLVDKLHEELVKRGKLKEF